jgi:hypothetical protein
LENYVINHLKSANEVNEFSTFEHYVKPVVEEVITENEETVVEEDNSEETPTTDTLGE